MKNKIDTREEVRVAIHYLTVCMAVFIYGAIYTIAAWGWMLISFRDPYIYYVLAGWAVLFYLFAFLSYPIINSLTKIRAKEK